MQKILLTLLGIIILGVVTMTLTKEKSKESKKLIEKKQEEASNSSSLDTPVVPKPKIKEKPKKFKMQTSQNQAIFKSKITPIPKTELTADEMIPEGLKELNMEIFKELQNKMSGEIQKIPSCLEEALTKEEAFSCSKNLRELTKTLMLTKGDFDEDTLKGYDENFTWNENTKIKMIKEIEASSQSMEEMNLCIDMAQNSSELDKCLNSK